jgi:hypothetical protein
MAVLLVCTIGFNAAARALHFRKKPLKLQVQGLDAKDGIPPIIAGRWVQLGIDRPLPPDTEKALKTKVYLNRQYVDLKSKAIKKTQQEWDALDPTSKSELAAMAQRLEPGSVISLHMAYYTGLVDTVAHIPERCMVADGYEPTHTDPADGPPQHPSARFRSIRFVDSMNGMTKHVGYLFHCNGGYTEDSIQVRMRLQNLFETYGYYAKIEMMITEPSGGARSEESQTEKAARETGSHTKATDTMRTFLDDLLPEVERCLPSWEGAKAGDPAVIGTD